MVRIQRTADLPSWTHSRGEVPLRLFHSIVGRHGHHASRSQVAAMLFKLLGRTPIPTAAEEEDDGRTFVRRSRPLGPDDVQVQLHISDGFVEFGLGSFKGRGPSHGLLSLPLIRFSLPCLPLAAFFGQSREADGGYQNQAHPDAALLHDCLPFDLEFFTGGEPFPKTWVVRRRQAACPSCLRCRSRYPDCRDSVRANRRFSRSGRCRSNSRC